MKVLCLHGSYGSAKAFRTQLDPFVSKIELSGDGSFTFVDGQFPVVPPEGFVDYFGPPPHYRNIDFDGIDGLAKIIDNLRDVSEAETYEDTLRGLMKHQELPKTTDHILKTFVRIKEHLDADPDIDAEGSADPYLYGAMSLYAVCDEDNATLFDHGKGHTVPRDQQTIHELVESILSTVAKASA
ncbi:hypothetical protein PWT90_01527 [Aphanocladium album]|nr:hypothetical protein PWT90_01527 [Aphanocladium album]